MKRLFAAVSALFLGAALAMAQDYNAAVDTFNSINGAESKLDKLDIARSALKQFEECNEDEAAVMVEKCKEIIPDILINLGKECINDKKFDEAEAYLKEAIALAKEYELSEEVEAKALKNMGKVFAAKGNALIKANDYAGAVEAMKEAVVYDAENGKYWLILTQAYFKAGSYEEAIETAGKAAELGQAAKANQFIFNSYVKLGDAKKATNLSEAVEMYEKAFEVDSQNAKLAMKIGNTYLQGGANAKAISFFQKYLEIDPEASDANDVIYTIAATAQKAGDKVTAIEYYSKIVNDAKWGAQARQLIEQLNK